MESKKKVPDRKTQLKKKSRRRADVKGWGHMQRENECHPRL